jgi:hypothetical protein
VKSDKHLKSILTQKDKPKNLQTIRGFTKSTDLVIRTKNKLKYLMRQYLSGGLSYKIEKGCRSYQLLPEILYLNFLFFRVQRYSN